MEPEEILQHVDHRPWALPPKRWAGRMRWCDLAFLHWSFDPEVIRPLIPPALELDTFDGRAWLGIVPFRMENIRVRFTPPIPGTHAFPEINVRTYARVGHRTGVWFFSLDAANALAVRGARTLFNLPYYDATITVDAEGEGIRYDSTRVHTGAPGAEFRGHYAPTGPVYHAAPGTLDHFLTERYCLFNLDRHGGLGYLDIHHLPWPLQPATVTIEANTMAAAIGLDLRGEPPRAHVARVLDVVAWNREPIAE